MIAHSPQVYQSEQIVIRAVPAGFSQLCFCPRMSVQPSNFAVTFDVYSQHTIMEEAPDIEIESPWPYLSKLFEVVERKNDSFIFNCLLCLPQKHTISSFKNSPSNLKLHIKVIMIISNDISTRYCKQKALYLEGVSGVSFNHKLVYKGHSKTLELHYTKLLTFDTYVH